MRRFFKDPVMVLLGVLMLAAVALVVGSFTHLYTHPDKKGSRPPVATVRFRDGYQLSSKPRRGWVPVTYDNMQWWVAPTDLTPNLGSQ